MSTVRYDGRGWLVLKTLAGPVPEPLARDAVEHEGRLLTPLTLAAAQTIRAQRSAHLDIAAERCLQIVERGGDPPPARLVYVRGMDGEELRLEVLWDPDIGLGFAELPGANGTRSVPLDPWLAEALDAFIALHEVAVTGEAVDVLERLLAEHRSAADAVRRSRATEAEPIAETAAVLGGEPAPFQWAAVRYALEARGTFLADEQGLGKTVEALTALEADGAYPAVVVCPASMKLGWERETQRWLPHRSVAVVQGRGTVPAAAEITIVNYEVVAAHYQALTRRRPRALVVDESHYCKNPQAKRTQAVRRLAAAVAPGGLRLALSGTPVLNHAEELIAQLRIIGRMEEFGSGASFARRFRGMVSEERLHWHMRRACFVRRLKSEVLPQLPAKRQVVIPVALTNDVRVPAGRARRHRLAALPAAGPLRAQRQDRRHAAGPAPGPARHPAAAGRPRQAGGGAGLDRGLPRLRRAAGGLRPSRRGPARRAGALPGRAAPASARTRSPPARHRSPPSRSPTVRS